MSFLCYLKFYDKFVIAEHCGGGTQGIVLLFRKVFGVVFMSNTLSDRRE